MAKSGNTIMPKIKQTRNNPGADSGKDASMRCTGGSVNAQATRSVVGKATSLGPRSA